MIVPSDANSKPTQNHSHRRQQQQQHPIAPSSSLTKGFVDLVPQIPNFMLRASIKKPRRFYAKSVLAKESQFSFEKGSNACTYISLEAAVHKLSGLIHADDPHLTDRVRRILAAGAQMDQGLGYTSCDQVFELSTRFRKHLHKGNLVIAKLRDPSVFQRLLDLTVSKSGGKEPYCVILTKPPETIAVFYDPDNDQFPFAVFDSHPRMFEPELGAGFYFFKDLQSCKGHLMELFRDAIEHAIELRNEKEIRQASVGSASWVDDGKSSDKMSQYELESYGLFDATFVTLAPNVEFEEAEFHTVGESMVRVKTQMGEIQQKNAESMNGHSGDDDMANRVQQSGHDPSAATDAVIRQSHAPTAPPMEAPMEEQSGVEGDVAISDPSSEHHKDAKLELHKVIRELQERICFLELELAEERTRVGSLQRENDELRGKLQISESYLDKVQAVLDCRKDSTSSHGVL